MSRRAINSCFVAPNIVKSNVEIPRFVFWWKQNEVMKDAKEMNFNWHVVPVNVIKTSNLSSEDAAVRKQMMTELDTISSYETGWDGYDAAPIDNVVIERLRGIVRNTSANLLKHWMIAPSVNGSVSLVSKKRMVVSMSIGNNGFSFVAKAPGKDAIKGNSSYDFNIFNTVFSEITNRFLID